MLGSQSTPFLSKTAKNPNRQLSLLRLCLTDMHLYMHISLSFSECMYVYIYMYIYAYAEVDVWVNPGVGSLRVLLGPLAQLPGFLRRKIARPPNSHGSLITEMPIKARVDFL